MAAKKAVMGVWTVIHTNMHRFNDTSKPKFIQLGEYFQGVFAKGIFPGGGCYLMDVGRSIWCISGFYRAMLCIAHTPLYCRKLSVSSSVCLSVCLSQAGILSKRFNTSSTFFHLGRHTILLFAVPSTGWRFGLVVTRWPRST